MCDALKELMAEEFEEVAEEVAEKVTEKVTDEVTTQMIKNAYESLGDIEKVAQILKISNAHIRWD